jgi:hypothetical protein
MKVTLDTASWQFNLVVILFIILIIWYFFRDREGVENKNQAQISIFSQSALKKEEID